MKYLIFVLFILASGVAHAQEYPDMRTWMLAPGDTADRYIFSDTAFIRRSPDTKQAPLDTLLLGDNIKVLDIITGSSLTIRNLKGPWLKISYNRNGEERTGYVWQGLVSMKPLRRGDTKYIWAIDRKYKVTKDDYTSDYFNVVIKVLQNGKVVGKESLSLPDNESANFSDGRIMSGMGLTNVQNVVTLSFSGAACGVDTYDHYFAFTKDNILVKLPYKTNMGDAGAAYHEETFTFPNEKDGQPDLIIWDMMEGEATEKTDKNGEPIFKTTDKKRLIYRWNSTTSTITQAG
jgi:hypothetical protein